MIFNNAANFNVMMFTENKMVVLPIMLQVYKFDGENSLSDWTVYQHLGFAYGRLEDIRAWVAKQPPEKQYNSLDATWAPESWMKFISKNLQTKIGLRAVVSEKEELLLSKAPLIRSFKNKHVGACVSLVVYKSKNIKEEPYLYALKALNNLLACDHLEWVSVKEYIPYDALVDNQASCLHEPRLHQISQAAKVKIEKDVIELDIKKVKKSGISHRRL